MRERERGNEANVQIIPSTHTHTQLQLLANDTSLRLRFYKKTTVCCESILIPLDEIATRLTTLERYIAPCNDTSRYFSVPVVDPGNARRKMMVGFGFEHKSEVCVCAYML
jgi:hypothetical protein